MSLHTAVCRLFFLGLHLPEAERKWPCMDNFLSASGRRVRCEASLPAQIEILRSKMEIWQSKMEIWQSHTHVDIDFYKERNYAGLSKGKTRQADL